jgi:predicted MFS family arabinose efflux permease
MARSLDLTARSAAREQAYWVAWAATLIFFAGFYALLIPLPRHLERSGLADWQIGLVLGAFGVAALVGRPLAGLATDRWGPQPVLLAGSAALTLGALGVGFTTSLLPLFGLRLLQAAGYVAFTTASTALIITLSPEEQRGRRLAIFGAAANVAIALSPAAVGLLLRYLPLNGAFWVAGGLAGLAGALMLAGGRHGAEHAPRPGPRPPARLADLLSVAPRQLWLPMGALAIGGLGFGAFFQFAPILADRRGGVEPALLYSVYGAGIIATRLLGGSWLDRVGVGRAVGLAFGVMACGLGLLALAEQAIWLCLAALLTATGSGLFHPALLAHHARLLPDAPGRASAAAYIGFDLGLGLGSWLLGLVLQAGGLGALYGVAAAVVLGGTLLALQLTKDERRKTKDE